MGMFDSPAVKHGHNRVARLAAMVVVPWLLATDLPVCTAQQGETRLQGQWNVIGLKARGREVSSVSFDGMKWEFDKDKYTMTPGTRTPAGINGKPALKGPFALNDAETPKHFTFTMVRGESKREVNAIYRIKDGKLELCLGGSERPTTFDTTGTRNLCYQLERANNDKDASTDPAPVEVPPRKSSDESEPR